MNRFFRFFLHKSVRHRSTQPLETIRILLRISGDIHNNKKFILIFLGLDMHAIPSLSLSITRPPNMQSFASLRPKSNFFVEKNDEHGKVEKSSLVHLCL
jgi:hypothetical protein